MYIFVLSIAVVSREAFKF